MLLLSLPAPGPPLLLSIEHEVKTMGTRCDSILCGCDQEMFLLPVHLKCSVVCTDTSKANSVGWDGKRTRDGDDGLITVMSGLLVDPSGSRL